MRILGVCFAALIVSACATGTVSQPQVSMCGDVKNEFSNWRADLFAKNPTAQERPLDANETEVFISAYNATPPVSHLSAAHIAVYHVEGFPQMLVVWLDESSCVQNTSMIPVEHMKKLLKGYPVYPTNQKQT